MAEYLVNRYNVAAGVSTASEAVSESQLKAQQRALEKFEKSFFTIPLSSADRSLNQDCFFKSLSISALMQSALIECQTESSVTTLTASEFFERLIKHYSPLLADSRDEPQAKDLPKETKEDKKQATRKGLKNLVMGQLKDVSSIKLSDFIDDKFLEGLDDVDETAKGDSSSKQPVQMLID